MSDGKWQGGGPTFWEDAKPYPERRALDRWLEQQIRSALPQRPERHGSNCLPSCGILTGKNRLGADHTDVEALLERLMAYRAPKVSKWLERDET